MKNKRWILSGPAFCLALALAPVAAAQVAPEPLVVGETFVLQSSVLNEARRINVYLPDAYAQQPEAALPVLYMPDGGLHEDFLHIAGLVQIGSLNWTMRPFILVGIENTQRRRDLTGPTTVASDREIAPVVGGAGEFRRFIRTELMPAVNARYRTTGETAIVGESLAGLFVVETLLEEPGLFDTGIAIDPSLWWDDGRLVRTAVDLAGRNRGRAPRLHLAVSGQEGIDEATRELAGLLAADSAIATSFREYPDQTHLTIYHPAALDAFREVFPRPEQ